jgi:hypothetical protein
MSTTYSIACKTCKVKLWIGQRNYIYTSQPDTMDRFGDFLFEHEGPTGHDLAFVSDHCDFLSKCKEYGSMEERDSNLRSASAIDSQ